MSNEETKDCARLPVVAYVHPLYLKPNALGFEASARRLAAAQVGLCLADDAQPHQAVAVTDEVSRLLEDLAQYAPAAGVLCAPTATMGFGSRAKRILSALSAHKTGEEE